MGRHDTQAADAAVAAGDRTSVDTRAGPPPALLNALRQSGRPTSRADAHAHLRDVADGLLRSDEPWIDAVMALLQAGERLRELATIADGLGRASDLLDARWETVLPCDPEERDRAIRRLSAEIERIASAVERWNSAEHAGLSAVAGAAERLANIAAAHPERSGAPARVDGARGDAASTSDLRLDATASALARAAQRRAARHDAAPTRAPDTGAAPRSAPAPATPVPAPSVPTAVDDPDKWVEAVARDAQRRLLSSPTHPGLVEIVRMARWRGFADVFDRERPGCLHAEGPAPDQCADLLAPDSGRARDEELIALEQLAARFPFLLDVEHRICAVLAAEPPLADALAAHHRALRRALAACPELAKARHANGLPCADARTRRWLDEAVCIATSTAPTTPIVDASKSGAPTAPARPDATAVELDDLLAAGDAATALGRAAALIAQARDGRERYALQARLVRTLAALDRSREALALGGHLLDVAADRALAAWEPAVVAPVALGVLDAVAHRRRTREVLPEDEALAGRALVAILSIDPAQHVSDPAAGRRFKPGEPP